MSDTEPTTAIERVPVTVGAPITDLDQAFRLSKALALAAVLPNSLRGKPSDILAILLYGQDLGLTPMQAIQGIYVVRGKPQLSAITWTALARRAGHKVRWGACDDKSATVTIERSDDPDEPHTETFTIEDAIQAGLCKIVGGEVQARSSSGERLPWETYTRTMLRNRAISFAGKLQCPEVALGFAIEGDYDFLEDDTEPIEVTPVGQLGEQEIVDAEVVEDSEAVRADILAAEADYAVPDNYVCQQCGVPGVHTTEECPEATA